MNSTSQPRESLNSDPCSLVLYTAATIASPCSMKHFRISEGSPAVGQPATCCQATGAGFCNSVGQIMHVPCSLVYTHIHIHSSEESNFMRCRPARNVLPSNRGGVL